MNQFDVSPAVRYAGVDDKAIDLFEGQYVVPNGISYNSYVILDEKIAVMDTVDARAAQEWLANVEAILGDRAPDYLVVHHMEPDHSGSIAALAEKYPQMRLVGSEKTAAFLRQFFGEAVASAAVTVKEGETLPLGAHELSFYMAPMIHWPEVMVSYERSERLLFSADAFGTFGALSADTPWLDEARRYYCNIVGKYGAQVQALLKKAAALDIAALCPLHGPVLRGDLGYYLEKYDLWSRYVPETKGVLVAYASPHGHTAAAARHMAALLESRGETVAVADLARCDLAGAVADAFRFDRLVLACATYDGGMFPPMERFLTHLKSKGLRGRRVGLIENGTWAPAAAKLMRAVLESMKDMAVCEPVVSLRSAEQPADAEAMERLTTAICE